MTPPAALLELRKIAYAYPDGPFALTDVSLALHSGAKLALLGANGAGKSTLLLHLNGTLRPHRGEVHWQGSALSYSRPALNQLRSAVALVLQNPDDQLFAGSIREDVSFGPLNLDLPPSEVHRRVEQCLSVMGLHELADRAPHQLSFGQKKRAAIAGALALHPRLLILDEPTAGLDPAGKRSLLRYLEALHQQGITLVLSTHDITLARRWSNTVAVLKQGRLLACGSTASLLSQDSLLAEADLLED